MADDNRIGDAIKRFEKAMAGLEIAAASGVKRTAAQDALVEEIRSLKTANDELAGRLAQSNAEVDALKSTNRTASTRIDKVMDNIKTVLAGS